jgi:hypothetical protein
MLRPFVRKALAMTLVLALCATGWPAAAGDETKPAKTGKPPKPARVLGRVLDADGKPLDGVRVILVPLQAGGGNLTGTSGSNGEYVIQGVAHGLYEAVCDMGGQAYPVNRVLLVQPGRKLEATFRLGEFTAQDGAVGLEPGFRVAALDVTAAGVARLDEPTGPTGRAWLRTGKGVAVLVGVGALVVAGLIAASGPE